MVNHDSSAETDNLAFTLIQEVLLFDLWMDVCFSEWENINLFSEIQMFEMPLKSYGWTEICIKRSVLNFKNVRKNLQVHCCYYKKNKLITKTVNESQKVHVRPQSLELDKKCSFIYLLFICQHLSL